MAKKKKEKKGGSQKIEVASPLARELELLKSDHSSLVYKYNSFERDYACATQFLSYVGLYKKDNQMLIAQL